MNISVKKMLRNENIKVMDIDYEGRLNPALEWYKIRNPISMLIRSAMNEVLKLFPPCEFKNLLYRFIGIKIGKNVCISPGVHLDPLFPELINIEDNVILGWNTRIFTHTINQNKLVLGRIRIGQNVVVGGDVHIVLGTTIKRNSIVGVRAFVNKDINENEFVGGVPAKLIKKIYPKVRYKNINELVQNKAKKLKDKKFLIYSEDNSTISYSNFDRKANQTANLLLTLGIKKGNKISITDINSKEFLIIMIGALKIGAIFNPINPKLSKDELKYILNDTQTKIIFVDKENIKKVVKIKNELRYLQYVFHLKDYYGIIKKYPSKLKQVNVNLNDDALLMYSSGTTGNPKGIILTQKNILYESYSIARHFGLDADTVSMISLPLFFSGGLFPTFFSILPAGGTIVINKKFSKSKFWKTIDKFKVNYSYVVPTILSMLLNPPKNTSSYNLDSLRFIGCGGAPLAMDMLHKFEKQFKVNIVEGYGLTENCGQATFNSKIPFDVSTRKLGSVGIPIDICEIKIFDDNDNELSPNKNGEIVMKGINIFREYLNQPKKTLKAKKNSWLHTGDLGYKDEDGYLYITGRKKDIIKKGGVLISPVAIDKVFYKNNNVKDAATIGVPDEIYGEEIITYVVLKNKEKITKQELIDFCKKYIEEFKCPKEIIFIDEIPKSVSGKLLRKKLQEMYRNGRKKRGHRTKYRRGHSKIINQKTPQSLLHTLLLF